MNETPVGLLVDCLIPLAYYSEQGLRCSMTLVLKFRYCEIGIIRVGCALCVRRCVSYCV